MRRSMTPRRPRGRSSLDWLLLAALSAAAAGLTAIAVAQGTARRDGPGTIAVSEVRAGMTGYGLTVFRGDRPERFDVEVIDVLHNFQPDQDLILVRTDHPLLERAASVAGMSGSPIYLDGRLAGAYAYGWPFGKDPIAGVTPIADMLAEMNRPVRPDAFPGADRLARRTSTFGRATLGRGMTGGVPRAATTTPSGLDGESRARRAAASPRLAGLPAYRGANDGSPPGALSPFRSYLTRRGGGLSGDGPGPRPAATPLMLAGFGTEMADWLAGELAPLGILALQGGGGASGAQRAEPRTTARGGGADEPPSTSGEPPATPPSPGSGASPGFVDGGSIGVQLIRGDVAATAIGTVTHVAGRRLVAFGHPMMNAGETGLPTSTARVLHVLVSERRSFKIGEAGVPQGTLIHDRQAAIVVDRDLEAPTVPVRLRIRGVPGAPRQEWAMEVVSHRVLTPLLTFAAIGNALKATASDQTDVTFEATTRVRLAGRSPIELVDRGWVPGGPSDLRALSSLRMFALMEAAYGNPFEETRVLGVDVTLDVRFARDVVEILDARLPAGEVDPGETVDLQVITRRYGEPEQVRVVPLRIPERAAGEELKVEVRAGDETPLEHPEPRSLDDLLRMVERRLPATALTASLEMPSRGLRFRGHVVRALPRSALDALQLANDGGQIRPFVSVERQVIDVGEVLTGRAELEVNVRDRARR